MSCRESHVVPRFVWPGPREGRCARIGRCAVIWGAGAAAHTRLGEAGPVIWGPLLWFASRGRGEEGPDQLMGTTHRGQSNLWKEDLKHPFGKRWPYDPRMLPLVLELPHTESWQNRWLNDIEKNFTIITHNIIDPKLKIWAQLFLGVISLKFLYRLVNSIPDLDNTSAHWPNLCQL